LVAWSPLAVGGSASRRWNYWLLEEDALVTWQAIFVAIWRYRPELVGLFAVQRPELGNGMWLWSEGLSAEGLGGGLHATLCPWIDSEDLERARTLDGLLPTVVVVDNTSGPSPDVFHLGDGTERRMYVRFAEVVHVAGEERGRYTMRAFSTTGWEDEFIEFDGNEDPKRRSLSARDDMTCRTCQTWYHAHDRSPVRG
jgi:hypothetical protein